MAARVGKALLRAGILAKVAGSHVTPLTRAFSSADFLQRLLSCAFAPAVCVQVPPPWHKQRLLTHSLLDVRRPGQARPA